MANPNEPNKAPEPNKPAEKAPDKQVAAAVTAAGGEVGKKAPALGTDPRPVLDPSGTSTVESAHKDAKPGELGDGGPSSDAKGVNQGNLREEEEQHPTQNATAGGPDAGQTPANAPGFSHGM